MKLSVEQIKTIIGEDMMLAPEASGHKNGVYMGYNKAKAEIAEILAKIEFSLDEEKCMDVIVDSEINRVAFNYHLNNLSVREKYTPDLRDLTEALNKEDMLEVKINE